MTEQDWLEIAVPGCAHFEGTGPNTIGDCIKPYICPAGKLTVLYGHVVQPGEEGKYLNGASIAQAQIMLRAAARHKPEGKAFLDKLPGWTHEQAKEVLARQLVQFGNTVDYYCTRKPDAHQKAGLVMLAYNIGLDAFHHSTVLRLHNAGDFGVHEQMAFQMWDKATVEGKMTELEGLRRRRRAEYFLYHGGSIAELDAKGWTV